MVEVKEEYVDKYNNLSDSMMFACIWDERPQGGYNSFDFNPFVAVKKVNNQGIEAYEGYYIDVVKKKGDNGFADLNDDNTFKWQVTISEELTYKPLSFFIEDGEDRITVSNSLNEICEMYLKRFENIECKYFPKNIDS